MNDLTLAWEMSTPHGSVTLSGENFLESREFSAGRGHDSDAFLALSELLQLAPLSALRRILIGSGPGSYSSSRIAIAAAQSIALAATQAGSPHCPIIAIPSFLALPTAQNSPACTIIGDARRQTWWHISLEQGKPHSEPVLADAGPSFLQGLPPHLPCLTMAAERPTNFAPHIFTEVPHASLLLQAWQNASPAQQQNWQNTPPQPFYLRAPFISRPAKYDFT